MVNVLVIGSGGREHSLGWKLIQSPNVDRVFFAPGNGGTFENNVNIDIDDFDSLADFAKTNNCFTVVGPEVPLAAGIVDFFQDKNLQIFGPQKDAARLESSKIWAKQFMKRNSIPTAEFEIFNDPLEASEYIKLKNYPMVIKADGLAAGKGVIVCDSQSEALAAVDLILTRKKFGTAGASIIVEERIDGVEASYIAMSDGHTIVPMASSQDHKRIFDNDKGPNTGGMGAYSPTPVITSDLEKKIQSDVMEKTISGLKEENITFKGFLYAGIMIKDGIPFVLEFNVRMGDPECQPIMARFQSDLFEYLNACVNGNLSDLPSIRWEEKPAVCVILASKGYPESYLKNEEILGLDNNFSENTVVFHAGTKKENSKILTNGGRVLGITSLGDSLEDSIQNAYTSVEKISWPSKYCRSDIGKKGLNF